MNDAVLLIITLEVVVGRPLPTPGTHGIGRLRVLSGDATHPYLDMVDLKIICCVVVSECVLIGASWAEN